LQPAKRWEFRQAENEIACMKKVSLLRLTFLLNRIPA